MMSKGCNFFIVGVKKKKRKNKKKQKKKKKKKKKTREGVNKINNQKKYPNKNEK